LNLLADGIACIPHEPAVMPAYQRFARCTFLPHHAMDRERVEKFVGKYYTLEGFGQFPAVEVNREVGKIQRWPEFAASRSQLHHHKIGGAVHFSIQGPDAGCDQNGENRLKLLGGKEVTLFPERIAARPPVISELRIIESGFHEAVK